MSPLYQSIGLKIPYYSGVRDLVEQKAGQIRKIISDQLRNRTFNVKVDCATRHNRSFYGVNVQYIHNGKIEIRTLGTFELTGGHKAEIQVQKLKEILSSFDLSLEQVFAFTSDNASDMIRTLNLINEEIDSNMVSSDEESETETDERCPEQSSSAANFSSDMEWNTNQADEFNIFQGIFQEF
jgi:hypothetical protein